MGYPPADPAFPLPVPLLTLWHNRGVALVARAQRYKAPQMSSWLLAPVTQQHIKGINPDHWARHVISVCWGVAGIRSIPCSRSLCSLRPLGLLAVWPYFGQGKETSHTQSMWSHTQGRGKKLHILSEYVMLWATRALCTVGTLRAEFRSMN